ncbi:transcriptional regulator [Helicobacter sp. MIT 05-5294]|uniref:transcriptional regulator n=1 Tax=Helicobacter sp. MIT 05-5294 TaxID=1548150 RepID=UPI0010FEB823|nr:transcriptional regulator [Helicobacter sp. MIT 05-5294]TLD87322.1 transcriptional regulator [Helicobacter sp. MIT 05-5294]
MAGILQIDTKTLYNWKKRKPNLYRIIMLGFKFEEMLNLSKKHYEELLEIESTLSQ